MVFSGNVAEIINFDYITELLAHGYSAENHKSRAEAIIKAIYDSRLEAIQSSDKPLVIRQSLIQDLHQKCDISMSVLEKILAAYLDSSCLADWFGDSQASEVGIFFAHGSGGLHSTTTTFFPMLEEARIIHSENPDLFLQVFGTDDLEELGFAFLQNLPPFFVSNTDVRFDKKSKTYMRTFIAPLDFNNLASENGDSQIKGWLSSIVYLLESLKYLYQTGFRIIGGGGLIPALSSHGTFSRLEKINKNKMLAKLMAVFSGNLPEERLKKLFGEELYRLALVEKFNGFELLNRAKQILATINYSEMRFTSGHTGTTVLILETIQALREKQQNIAVSKIGFLGAGGSILRATIDALYALAEKEEAQRLEAVLYDIDKQKLKQSMQRFRQLAIPHQATSSFRELVTNSDIIVSAITILTKEMSNFFAEEYQRFSEAGQQASILQGKVFVEDTYPSRLPIALIQELGGQVVLVLGQEGNEHYRASRKVLPYHPALIDTLSQRPLNYLYGIHADENAVPDYGCGAELFTIIHLVQNKEAGLNIFGAAQSRNVIALKETWAKSNLIKIAPFQDGASTIKIG